MVMYFCPFCGRETEHMSVTDAAASVHVTRRTIYNWLERALVHFVHRPSGRKFICVRSLVVSNGFRHLEPPDPIATHQLFIRRPGGASRRHP